MTHIECYLKCFSEVLARWCFEPQPVYGTKVVSQTHILRNSIQPKPDQNTSNKAQSESFTLYLSIPSVYFALAGLPGALFTK
jgi:hypothetical protein